MTMTMAPPVVQPSLGLMALMHGVAEEGNKARFTLNACERELGRNVLKVSFMCVSYNERFQGKVQIKNSLFITMNTFRKAELQKS